MRSYYDDNYGVYHIESADDVAFYHDVQKRSVLKTCRVCGRKVKLQPDYDLCNACAEQMESGMQY